jgi:hypothetical protein
LRQEIYSVLKIRLAPLQTIASSRVLGAHKTDVWAVMLLIDFRQRLAVSKVLPLKKTHTLICLQCLKIWQNTAAGVEQTAQAPPGFPRLLG